MQRKSIPIAYLLWCFLGTLGVHRLYLRQYGWALVYLCTGGLFMIGWFVDAFLIPGNVSALNREIEDEMRLARARIVRGGCRALLPG
jgi:TM2 domain-containing membrane protein YozV